MLTGDLQRLVHAFLDRHGGHDHHELGESIALVQLKHATQVNVGLPGPRFHLDREIERLLVLQG
jgi:hypothetical protein